MSATQEKKYDTIRPGQVWLDTEGKRIQAHGGSIFYENDTYYWYGENKEKTLPGSGIWHWGIRCYSSKDLYNWKDEGLIIEPDLEHEDSPVHPSKYVDKPHIVYNEKTKKYVCWIKFAGMDASGHGFTILTADRLLGPYEIVVPLFFPLGRKVGDFDLVVDKETRKAYVYAETDVRRATCFTLTEDYLGVTDEYSEHFDGRYREGLVHFQRKGLHYLFTSGRTGYVPNPSDVSVSPNWHGPFEIQGNPHVNDEDEASFNTQICSVFKHPKKEDLYIVLADRWVPEFKVTKGMSKKIWGLIVSLVKKEPISEEDMAWYNALPMMDDVNTSIANYVWLPIRFDGDKALLDWKDEWRMEDYQ